MLLFQRGLIHYSTSQVDNIASGTLRGFTPIFFLLRYSISVEVEVSYFLFFSWFAL